MVVNVTFNIISVISIPNLGRANIDETFDK